MRQTTRNAAFLLTLGFPGFDFNIFYCNTSCLVYLPIQHRHKPISGYPGFFRPETGVSGWISGTERELLVEDPNQESRTNAELAAELTAMTRLHELATQIVLVNVACQMPRNI